MKIKLRLNKDNGPEPLKVEGGLLSNTIVTGKTILKTPFGIREIASDGTLKGGKERKELAIAESAAKTSTSKPTPQPKKGKKQ